MLDPEAPLNLICIGDNDYEMDAAKHFKSTTCIGKRCLLKLVKLKDDPTPNELEI